MSKNDQYALNWSNHTSHLKGALGNLLACNEFVDVTLSCEGRKVNAHKMVLSACSAYFRDLFRDNPCSHPIVILKDVKFQVLTNLLQFVYAGEVSVPMEDFDSFLRTAETLQISGLTDEDSRSTRCNPERPRTELDRRNDPKGDEPAVDKNPKKRVTCIKENEDRIIKKRSKREEEMYTSIVSIKQESQTSEEEPVQVVKHSFDSVQSSESSEEFDLFDAGKPLNPSSSEDFVIDDRSSRKLKTISKCEICLKQFSSLNNLKLHMPSHTGATTCYICRGVYSRMDYLKKHLRSVHGVDG